MRKVIVLAGIIAFATSSAFSQDLTSKKGEKYLPEAGDIAISIDATPFLNYVGNIFTAAGNTAPTLGSSNVFGLNTITGKYFVDAQTAYRVSLTLGFDNDVDKRGITDPSATAPVFPDDMKYDLFDKHTTNSTNIFLAAGMEKRRGSTRLQGIYGAEAGLGIQSNSDSYKYALDLDPATGVIANTNSSNFGANITTDGYGHTARMLKSNNGKTFLIGARGFVGAEYFIFPKIALAGEVGWGIGYALSGKSKDVVETTDGLTVEKITRTGGSKQSSFQVGNDIRNTIFGSTARLSLNLHF